MIRLSFGAALAAVVVCAAPSLAQTSTKPVVHRDGRVYTVAACGDTAPQGQARCHAHIVTDASGTFATSPNDSNPAGYHPSDLRAAYNVTAVGSGAITVAVVDAFGYNNAEGDLGAYRATFGLPACTTANGCFRKVNQNGAQGNYPAQNAGWGDETALDLDMVSAMCPNCHILLVEANNNGNGNLAAAMDTARRLGANVVSNSYGGNEAAAASLEPIYDVPGVVVLASTGDAGFGVQFPASSPHVIAVGGTSLVQNAAVSRGWSETAWSGGGSGCSTVFAKPAWQTDPLCAKRMEADVSAVADPGTGVAIFAPVNFGFRSGWAVVGGTSVASPLVAGIFGAQGGGAGTAAGIYTAWNANHAVLNDVVSGSNGSCGGTYFCTAGVGYDGPTGLGTPNGPTAF